MSAYDSDYRGKLTTPERAVELIKGGDTIVPGINFAEPPALLRALAARARAGGCKDIRTYSFNPQKHAASTIFSPDLIDVVQPFTWFVSAPVRGMVQAGLSYFVPSFLYQVPRLLREGMSVDVAMSAVSPMDKGGYFSLGAAAYMTTACRLAGTVIVEVNPQMPRVFGDAMVHVSDVAAIVENDEPLIETPVPEAKPEDEIVGKLIAEIVPDGASIQLGIGGLPNAAAACLAGHKDLGIHTELLGPGMVALIKKGVITGRRKTLHPRKHVFAVAYGGRDTFEFMNDNPSMESYSSEYVMDPNVIAQNDNMISVNSIIEVDLTGQCNAETIGGVEYSGTGGQLDFVRGAYASKGGKSILAFYSTARHGEVSRIVPILEAGTGVTTPRADVHYLATEWGIVNLKGKPSRGRALDIVSLAHPRFRDDLMREAEHLRLL